MMLSSLDRTAPRTPERSARRRCAGGLGLLLACVLAGGCGDDPPADAAQPVAPHRTAANESAPDADTATAVGVNLLADVGFTGDSPGQWTSNNEASRFFDANDLDPARARLVEKSQIHWQMPAPGTGEGDRFRLTVKARKVEVDPLRLRLQVTGLPQGGWAAKGTPEGEHIRNDIKVVDVDAFGWETHEFEITRAPRAVDVVIYLVNAGPRDVEVADIRFEGLAANAGRR